MKKTVLVGFVLVALACGSRKTSLPDTTRPEEALDVPEASSSEVSQETLPDVPKQEVPPGKTTISEVQTSKSSLQCSSDSIQNIRDNLEMADVVVASSRFVASRDKTTGETKLYGYYVVETGLETYEPYRGIYLVVDASADQNFQPGDVLSMTANYVEYYCLSELKLVSATKVGTAPVPLPLVVDDNSVFENGGDPAKAEAYEGILVTLLGLSVTNTKASDGKGWFEVGNGIQVLNDFDISWTPTLGTEIVSLTGFVKYHFGKYRIVPRSLTDIAIATTQPEPSPEVISGEEVSPQKGKVYDIQSSDTSVNCTNEGNNTIKKGIEVGPVVVTSPVFSASANLDGFYVSDFPVGQDPSFTGILVVAQKGTVSVVPGDEVILAGDYKEFYCMSEIYATSVQKTGHQSPPSPIPVDDTKIFEGGGYASLTEPYEGLIVTLSNVTITSTTSSDGKGWFQVGNAIEVVNDFGLDFKPAQGLTLKSLTGAVKYHFGKYRLAPRSRDDIVEAPVNPEPVPEPAPDAVEPDVTSEDTGTPPQKMTVLQLQAGDSSVNCTQEGNVTLATGIALADVVVVSPKFSASSSLDGYYVQDPVSSWPFGSDGKYTGMWLVVPKNLNTNFGPGDLISVVGDYKEFFCMTEVYATSAVKVGSADVPGPLDVNADLFANGGTSQCEPYEGLRVRISNVQVTDTTGGLYPNWWFKVGNNVFIANDFGITGLLPQQGQNIKSLTGAVKYSYKTYLIVPFSASDIVFE